MALRVTCPNGCRLQVPPSRAGMMVRCPKCKKIIKLAELSAATQSEDGMALIDAEFPTREELVELKKTVKQATDRSNLVRKSSASLQVAHMHSEQAAAEQEVFKAAVVAPAAKQLPNRVSTERPRDEVMFIEPLKIAAEKPAETEQRPPSKPSPQARWRMPEAQKEKRRLADQAKSEPRPSASETSPPASSPTSASALVNPSAAAVPRTKRPAKPPARLRPPTEIIEAAPVEAAPVKAAPVKAALVKSAPKASQSAVAKTNLPPSGDAPESVFPAGKEGEQAVIKRVGVSHNRDAKSRAIFLTFALVLIGAFAIIPAISSFASYVNTNGQTEIPRWAAWLVFLGVLHLFYAVYVGQLADWTSFRIISILMLVLTAIMATLLAGMALGGQGGLISRVFQIPLSLTTKAEIWLLTMLSITSLIGYLCGREAFRWKQIENQLRAAISPGD